MDCGDVREKLSELIDGELSNSEKEAVLSHIAECEDCKREYEELQTLKKEFSKLDIQLRGALSESVMNKICAEVYPKKKTPFFFRYIGTAAALLIIAAIAIYTRLTPLNESEQNADSEAVMSSDALAKPEHSIIEDEEKISDDGVTSQSSKYAEYSSELTKDSVPLEIFSESVAAPMPDIEVSLVNGAQRDDNLSSEAETSASTDIPSDPIEFRFSNHIPTSTSIIIVGCEIEEVIPLLDEVSSVSSDCINIDAHYTDVMDILTSNSLDVVYLDVIEDPSSDTSVFSSNSKIVE